MELTDFQQFIARYNTAYKETDQLYHRLARHFGLPDSTFWILYFLLEADRPVTQTELRDGLCLSKQTINSSLKSLEEQGHLRLSSGRRRTKYLHLTDRGQTLVRQTVLKVFQMEQRAFLGLTCEECDALLNTNRHWLELLRQESEVILDTSEEDTDSHEN